MACSSRRKIRARVKLPKDEIIKEFQRTLKIDTKAKKRNIRFKELQIAIAPGGFFSIRIGWAEIIEVAHFKAKEVDISWDYFAMTNNFNPEDLSEEEYISGFTKDLPERIKQQMEEGTLPLDRWQDFCTHKFPWHLATTIDLYGYTEFLINYDKYFVCKPNLNLAKYKDEQLVLIWYRLYLKQDGKRYRAVINFSKNIAGNYEQPEGDVEIFELFKEYFSSNMKSTALVIDIVNGELVAYLTNGTKQQYLPLYASYFDVLKDDDCLWFK